MQTKVEQDGEFVVIHLAGRLSYELVDPFHAHCLNSFKGKKLIFNFAHLDFVGSSGITSFLKTMHDLSTVNGNELKFCNVSSEFRRVIGVSQASVFEICDNVSMARQAYTMPAPIGQHLPPDHQIVE